MRMTMMTQASCEADVLSCYYLDALNKTEAVLLVNIFKINTVAVITNIVRCLTMILSQCMKPPGLQSCVQPSSCPRTFHTGSKNFNLIVEVFSSYWRHLLFDINPCCQIEDISLAAF